MPARHTHPLLLIEATACALLARTLLRCFPLRTAVGFAERVSQVLPATTRGTPDDCIMATDRVIPRVAHSTCLYRAFTAYLLLLRRDRSVCLHIGAARERELTAHAWVSIAGQPLDSEAPGYAPLWEAPPRGSAV
jgi:hypothetical protein